MSPRSAEFMERAREHLAAARENIKIELPFVAVSEGYYAMLDAARAALSEEDRYAKTHSGTWTLFRELFVAEGSFDAGLVGKAEEAGRLREATYYDAERPSEARAAAVVADAERFVQAVDEMLE